MSFQKLFPAENLDGRRLLPVAAVDTGEVRERIATRERRAKSVKVIAEHQGVPDGASLDLDLNTLVKPEVVAAVDAWLEADPVRRQVTWVNDPTRPLRWAAAEVPNATWSPTSLRDAIFEAAAVGRGSFSAADAWCYQGENLYGVAQSLIAQSEDGSET